MELPLPDIRWNNSFRSSSFLSFSRRFLMKEFLINKVQTKLLSSEQDSTDRGHKNSSEHEWNNVVITALQTFPQQQLCKWMCHHTLQCCLSRGLDWWVQCWVGSLFAAVSDRVHLVLVEWSSVDLSEWSVCSSVLLPGHTVSSSLVHASVSSLCITQGWIHSTHTGVTSTKLIYNFTK